MQAKEKEIDIKKEEVTEKDDEKKKVLETILKELKDPDRNMNNFDPGHGLIYETRYSSKEHPDKWQ